MRIESIRNWTSTLASVFIAVTTVASYLVPLQPAAVEQSAGLR